MTRDLLTPVDPAVPRLADTVGFERSADGASWLVSVDGVPVSRASDAVAAALRAMDGVATLDDLRRRFAPDQTPEAFGALVDRFRRAGLLRGAERRTAGRLTYRPPLTVQFATLRAPVLFARLHRVLRPVLRRALLWPLAVLVLAGVVALVAQAPMAAEALTSPLPLDDLLLIAVVLVCATVAHEAAHGVTLTHGGARPRRAGFMLLYLGPAFFVDVTDAWRLPSRTARVAVALAGPAVHAVLAGAAALAALVVTDADLRRTLLVLACACATVVAVNLVPFVRFDGYIALMSALDEPNLRARTMADAAEGLRGLLFGGERSARALDRWWSVPFGILSVVVPTVIVWLAVERAIRALVGTGPVGAFLVLALQAVVVIAVGAGVARWVARCWRLGRGRLRFLALSGALLGASVALAALVPVDDVRTMGYATTDDGVTLVVPAGATGEGAVAIAGGRSVDLSSSGILADAHLVAGRTRATSLREATVPLTAFSPVALDDVAIDALVVGRVDVPAATTLPSAGRAGIHLGTRSLLEAVWATHVAVPASLLVASLLPPPPDSKEDR
ncbi:hypothetical protein D8Y23_08770 [Microbacterium enclense]|uniref:Peptide zinc metalloprotease protein n=1 Tax=Microbacterium enclense TaxID=993073 RepID=A0A443JEE2_9MICO|nr:daptide biosynthesis intramembrane metalloprotease [Microbacterium enclense]RWR18851.1 hypothetical protein D8Y23_08770 [Microbacterium enclense]